jgi:hypothetical protein
MTQAELPKIFHLQFTPEQWSQLVRLRALIGKPLPTGHNVFHITDIVSVVRNFDSQVRVLLEEIAKFYLTQLLPIPRMYPCGLYRGLMYIRVIEPSPNLNFNSGHCGSWDWFEQSPEKICPLATRCEAYTRKWPGGNAAALTAGL